MRIVLTDFCKFRFKLYSGFCVHSTIQGHSQDTIVQIVIEIHNTTN